MIKKNNITLNKIDSKIITKIEDVKIVKFCEIISIFFIFKMTFWYCTSFSTISNNFTI